MNMLREQALPYVSYVLDNAGGVQHIECSPVPSNTVLVGWQCGNEPMFVAVKSYLPNTTLDQADAVEIAQDYLVEIGWFDEVQTIGQHIEQWAASEPDYIIGGKIG